MRSDRTRRQRAINRFPRRRWLHTFQTQPSTPPRHLALSRSRHVTPFCLESIAAPPPAACVAVAEPRCCIPPLAPLPLDYKTATVSPSSSAPSGPGRGKHHSHGAPMFCTTSTSARSKLYVDSRSVICDTNLVQFRRVGRSRRGRYQCPQNPTAQILGVLRRALAPWQVVTRPDRAPAPVRSPLNPRRPPGSTIEPRAGVHVAAEVAFSSCILADCCLSFPAEKIHLRASRQLPAWSRAPTCVPQRIRADSASFPRRE